MKSKVCVVTAYTPEGDWKNLGEAAVSINKEYCTKWGYDFIVHTSGFDKSRPPSWSKLHFVRMALRDYEWVFWIDGDAVFTNRDIPLDEYMNHREELVVSKDDGGPINFGVFLLRRSDFADSLLSTLWNRVEYIDHPWWEQAAIRRLYKEGFLDYHVKILPIDSGFNANYSIQVYGNTVWKPGYFIAHIMGGKADRKLFRLRHMMLQTNSLSNPECFDTSKKAVPAASSITPDMGITFNSPVCVVTAYDDDYKACGDFTRQASMLYCGRHKYDFRQYGPRSFDKSRHPAWSKVRIVREVLDRYEWVFWIDADAVIANNDVGIEGFMRKNTDLFICRNTPNNFFNMGTFLVRKSLWSFEFLYNLWHAGVDGRREHITITEMLTKISDGKWIAYNARAFNARTDNRPQMRWQPGDFIAHCNAKICQDNKVRELAKCLKQAWKGKRSAPPVTLIQHLLEEGEKMW